MSVWTIENGKLRPSYPECPLKHQGQICGGQTEPISFKPWECGVLLQRASGLVECCNDMVEVQCTVCDYVTCLSCMNGELTNR